MLISFGRELEFGCRKLDDEIVGRFFQFAGGLFSSFYYANSMLVAVVRRDINHYLAIMTILCDSMVRNIFARLMADPGP